MLQSHLGVAAPKVKKKHTASLQELTMKHQKSLDISTTNDGAEDVPPIENSSNQLVLHNSAATNLGQDALTILQTTENHPASFKIFSASNPSSRVLPSVGTFTVQCATCLKWRVIPTKEKYGEIRENVLQEPFVCDRARDWRPDISCDDPTDISQDGSRLWAIDKPNIAQPPPGWERLLRIRGEGSTRFADIYYVSPSGKRLRSMVEVEKYLLEHPEYIRDGVNLSQFSFLIPKPLQENYVRKRPASMMSTDNAGSMMPRPVEPCEGNPLLWADPPTHKELQNGRLDLSTPHDESPDPPTHKELQNGRLDLSTPHDESPAYPPRINLGRAKRKPIRSLSQQNCCSTSLASKSSR